MDTMRMSVQKKLQLVDELWLSMTPEFESLEVSQRDRELLDERWAAFLRDLRLGAYARRISADEAGHLAVPITSV